MGHAVLYAQVMLSVLTLILSPNPAFSAAICPMAKSQILDARALTGFVEDVNVIGKPDRQVASDFARDEPGGSTAAKIEKRYAASGDLDCGDQKYGQAQVVLKGDIIVSAAHVVMDHEECPLAPNPPASRCKFVTKIGNRVTSYAIEQIVQTGYRCDPGDKRVRYGNDWVIFKLKKPVDPAIRPYKIADDPEPPSPETNVVHVAKSPDFNPTNAHSLDKVVRHYGRCQTQYTNPQRNTVETDCDASPGSSGGGLFTPGEDPTLMAITVGVSKQPCSDGNGTNKVGEYRHGCWATLSTTISGDFLSALEKIKYDGSSTGGRAEPPDRPKPAEPYFKDL